MLRIKWFFCVCLFMNILVVALNPSISQATQKSDLDIVSSWHVFLELDASKKDQAVHALTSVYQDQIDSQIDALPMMSDQLIRMIGTQKHKYKTHTQHPYWAYAKRMNPYSPKPDYLVCHQNKGTGLLKRISHCATALKLDSKTKRGRMFVLAQASHILYLTIFCLVVTVLMSLFLKYLAFLFQYTSSKFIWLSPLSTGFFSCIIVACITLSFGWLAGLTLISASLWKFLTKSERFVVLLLFLCTALIPLTFQMPGQYIAFEKAQALAPSKITAQKQELLYQKPEHFTAGHLKTAFTQSLYKKTFFHHNNVQLFSMIGLAALIMFLLGMFNHVGDYYFIFEKQQMKSKKLIIRDLKAYPKLYFNFIDQLKKEDRISKFLFFIFPPYYYFERENPIVGFVLSFTFILSACGFYVSTKYIHANHFLLQIAWGLMAVLFLAIFWSIPKHTKNKELHVQKITYQK